MRTAASLDALTGLLNRDGLRRRMMRALARQSDGGAAVLLMREDVAKALGYQAKAYIRSYAYAALDPRVQLR